MKTNEPKLLGTHPNCGGNVFYLITGSMGIRYYKKCGQSSHKSWTDKDGNVQRPLAPEFKET